MTTINIRLFWIAAFLLFARLGSSQTYSGGNAPPPPRSPEQLAAEKYVRDLYAVAYKLSDSKQFSESVPAYRFAIAADIKLLVSRGFGGDEGLPQGFGGIGHYGIARSYTELGRFTEALAAYRLAFQASPREGSDLYINGPAGVAPYMNYAILLARAGRAEDAKAVYYAGLRRLNPNLDARDEPIPLLVVFDPDLDATVWPYTPQNLEAAADMAKAIEKGYDGRDLADAVRALRPDWAVPVLHRAKFLFDGPERDAAYSLATSLAKTDAEREAIRWSKGWNRDEKPTDRTRPVNLRKQLQILRSTRKKMEIKANWDAIATERK